MTDANSSLMGVPGCSAYKVRPEMTESARLSDGSRLAENHNPA
eukprot:CAMPEP_0168791560 /NCGR_PEP_ID=MMETSP0725-20121227/14048_1 /TAXON_ID=265536 /ORGANISM="Amphiprora sp., Strain CCMP467" /LENGTH=42 /DNA_ID= /DNA_START= /DNA_END= /DNA_ORIENTATION=